MRKLLIALGILVVLLVIIDRIALVLAEDQISSRIASAYDLPTDPGVSIAGFPFLTQVVSGDYGQINVTASQVQADGATLHDLNVRLTDVHATISQVLGSGTSTVTAGQASGSALVNFATVDQRLPHGLRVTSAGKNLMVSGKVSYRGIRVPVSGSVGLKVSDAGITVTPKNVSVAGGLNVPLGDLTGLKFLVPLGNLPLHLHLTSVQVTPAGLRISAAAQNVQFARA
jgi:LmeA-like phospholipid-binding